MNLPNTFVYSSKVAMDGGIKPSIKIFGAMSAGTFVSLSITIIIKNDVRSVAAKKSTVIIRNPSVAKLLLVDSFWAAVMILLSHRPARYNVKPFHRDFADQLECQSTFLYRENDFLTIGAFAFAMRFRL